MYFWVAFPSRNFELEATKIETADLGEVNPDILVAGSCELVDGGVRLPWHTRNALHMFAAERPDLKRARIQLNDGMVFNCALPDTARPSAVVGWLPDRKGRFFPRRVSLKEGLRPEELSLQASNMNLSLMKWQASPDVQLEELANKRVLLLGAGTLGCNVARSLIGWGVRSITFVDNGTVSLSNPTRQPLFTFTDALKRAPKAEAAAAALSQVQPAAAVHGVHLSIPMPGHHSEADSARVAEAVQALQKLVSASDILFLLTDSRESRWLPTVLCCVLGVPLLNVALGFDTCLIMRHGQHSTEAQSSMGCYFCADIVAPTDSSGNRTLDQQCTVTRPGLAAWASAMAVELLVNTLHHTDRFEAGGAASSSLGDVPHTLRCDISTFSTSHMVTHSFSACSGCAFPLVQAVREQGVALLTDLLTEKRSLSELCGLDTYYADAAAAADGWQDDDLAWE
jgi:ubiquitin-like modifier-activating enzyme ATG7